MADGDDNRTFFAGDDNRTFFEGDDNRTVAPTMLPDGEIAVTEVAEAETELNSEPDSEGTTMNPRNPLAATSSPPSGETFLIPMPAPSMSDTLPPSVPPAAGAAAAAAGPPGPGVGGIERMGHTIQALTSENEVLRSTVSVLSASVATLAAAASSSAGLGAADSSGLGAAATIAAAGASSVAGPSTAVGASTATTPWVDPMIAKGNKRFAQPTNEWEWWERQRRDAKNRAEADRKQRKTLAQAKSKSAASPGPHL